MGSNKAGKRIPERGQYGNTRGKERQRRRIDNRQRDPRYQAAMEETRKAQEALDARLAEEAANPVLGHAEGALLMKKLELSRQTEAEVKAIVEAEQEEPAREPVAPEPDEYIRIKRHKPFDIDSVPAHQEGDRTKWVLGAARQMLIKGHSLAHVVQTTGWGKDWFSDIPVDKDGYGLGTEAWLESLDKKEKKELSK